MNATQLRALGFDEAADAAESAQWQGEQARVYVAHISKSPLDADLCTERAALAELTDDEIALMEARCSDDVKWMHYNSATKGA